MDKLFSVRLLRSICRNVLFIVFLELTIVYKGKSHQEICMTSNKRNITYSYTDIAESTWFAAWEKCNNLTSTLPVICDKSEEDALTSYLAHARFSSIWTSGKKINFTDWKWINGQPFKNGGMISQHDSRYTHVVIEANGNYRAQSPQHKSYYLCQYSGSSCNSRDAKLDNGRCARPSGDDRTWFDARNQCLINGGDLAVVDNTIIKSNMTHASRSYWIGLRKTTWHWMRRNTDGLGEEIKYTNWANDSLYGECISINASAGEWKATSCTDKKTVVCQTISGETTSSASSKMTTSRPTPIVSNHLSTTTNRPQSISNTLISTTTDEGSHVLLYSGVGAGIAFIIICIIVIIVVAKRTRRSDKDQNQTKIKNKSEQNRPDLSPDLSPNKPASSTDTAQVTGADDPRAVYAEISPATLNQPELKSNTEQPGIVYASLDFQKEPTSLELDRKSAHATENPPIYAN